MTYHLNKISNKKNKNVFHSYMYYLKNFIMNMQVVRVLLYKVIRFIFTYLQCYNNDFAPFE